MALAALAGVAAEATQSAALAATARSFLDAPGGGPLSADERAFVEHCAAGIGPDQPVLSALELDAALREIEATMSAG